MPFLNPVLQYQPLGGDQGGGTGWGQKIKGSVHHVESLPFIQEEVRGHGSIRGSDQTWERAPMSRRLSSDVLWVPTGDDLGASPPPAHMLAAVVLVARLGEAQRTVMPSCSCQSICSQGC